MKAGMAVLYVLILVGGALSTVTGEYAQALEAPPDLLLKVDDHEKKIKELEADIAAYEKELANIGGEKRTLESAVRELDLSRKKVSANIQVEERKIAALGGEIGMLEVAIGDAESSIGTLKDGLRALIAQMYAAEEQSLVETLLKAHTVEGLWAEVDNAGQVNVRLRARVGDLETKRHDLTATKQVAEEKRAERVEHQHNLLAQKKALDITQREKKALLASTNQKESSYQKQLEEKRAAKLEFEAALRSLESELTYTLDPTRIPPAGKGVLMWPLASVFVTQKFGNTDFARSGAYKGQGHNGIDFRASIGTPIKAALSGTISGTGNTDAYRGCYSYGKWVLIKHANGLSTLYAHLSDIGVSSEQTVATGEVVGYSGSTGYATGPHLHFGVYVTDALKIVRLGEVKSKTNCANATIPIAPLNAYLNPLEYL